MDSLFFILKLGKDIMKIALAQMKMSTDRNKNFKKSLDLIKEASRNKADLILFPEIQLTEFFPQYEDGIKDNYAITLDSEYVENFRKAAKKYNIMISPNLYIKEGSKYFDTSLLIDRSGEILGMQKMVHVASFPNFYETKYYMPSEDGFNIIETELGKIGIAVCFDRHFPESIRILTLKGADLILIPTANTIDEPEDLFKWEILIQSFQNEIPIVMCNRTGKESNMVFSGHSMSSNSKGELLLYAPEEEGIYYIDINIEEKNRKYLPLRREEMYET